MVFKSFEQISPIYKSQSSEFDALRKYIDEILLCDVDDFIENKVESLRKKLKKMGSKKIFLDDKRYYWDLKPRAAHDYIDRAEPTFEEAL